MWSIDCSLIIPWLDTLDDRTVACIFAALEVLEREGPALGRPLVDTLEGSSFGNMKELRPASPGAAEVRILFAFDPRREAVLLIGGDKAKGKNGKAKWSSWYKQAIPKAEALYRTHLDSMEGSDGKPTERLP